MMSSALLLVLLLLLALSSAYTTIDDASRASSLWSSGQFEVLLDVRRAEEWDAGHLPNATFIPSLQESKDTSRLAGCEDCAIAVYCHSGHRAKQAANVLEASGFTNVYNVLGINQWVDVGVALVSDEDREPCCDCHDCVNTKNEGAGKSTSASVLVAIAINAIVSVAVLIT